jgi:hypothetical protein
MADSDSDMYIIDQIVGKKIGADGRPMYKVRWKGYLPEDDTWEPLKHLKLVMDEVHKYEKNASAENQKSKKVKPPQAKVSGRSLVPKSKLKRLKVNPRKHSEAEVDLEDCEVVEVQPSQFLGKTKASAPEPKPTKAAKNTEAESSSLRTSLPIPPPVRPSDLFVPTSLASRLLPPTPALSSQHFFSDVRCCKADLGTAEIAEIVGCRHTESSLSWFVTFKPKDNEVYFPEEFTSSKLKRTFPIQYSKLMFDVLCFTSPSPQLPISPAKL